MTLNPTLLEYISALSPIVLAVFGGWYARFVGRKERFRILLDVHRDLTTGEVAEARNSIGGALYGSDSAKSAAEKAGLVQALFSLYWAVERADNAILDQTEGVDRRPGSKQKWDDAKEEYLTWNLDEIVGEIVRFRARFSQELKIEDDDAWGSFILRLRKHNRSLYMKYSESIVEELR